MIDHSDKLSLSSKITFFAAVKIILLYNVHSRMCDINTKWAYSWNIAIRTLLQLLLNTPIHRYCGPLIGQ